MPTTVFSRIKSSSTWCGSVVETCSDARALQIRKVHDINFLGPLRWSVYSCNHSLLKNLLLAVQAFVPTMVANKFGRIVNVVSMRV